VGNPSGAVFLSYSSEDAAAAEKLANALGATGIEVWFDKSELRGGDAWDRRIREQIHDCRLFIAIISAHSEARDEGYFRREWRLAVDRTHDMAERKTFLVPVVIDDTGERSASVPDKFREVQWTRLPQGAASPAFIERIRNLLSQDGPTEVRPRGLVPPAASAPISGSGSADRSRGKPALLWAVPVVAALAIGAWYATKWWSSVHAHSVAVPSDATAAAAQAVPQKSIAVLPFVDMSEHRDQEYFSDGLAEELLDLLSQVPDLRVPARTSSFYFKGRNVDIVTIARQLRVAHLLEGSVRKSDKHIRVTAQLIRADNGYHLWSKTYDRDLQDVFQVQDEIANAVVTALKARLLDAQPLTNRHYTDNAEAYTQYLLGNQLRDRDTPEFVTQALEAYKRAVTLDPGFAAGYAGLAEAEWRVVDMVTGDAAGYQRARAAAERAIALAPSLPDGYWAREKLRTSYEYDWKGGESDLRMALAQDPNDVRVLGEYGAFLATFGRYDEALQKMHQSLALDPLSMPGWLGLAHLQLDLGQLSEAKDSANHVSMIAPDSERASGLNGEVALAEGRYTDVIKGLARSVSAWHQIGTAMAEYSLGHQGASQAALDELIARYGRTLAYQVAEVYGWRGDRDHAFSWLERAIRQHDGGMAYLRHDRYMKSLRTDPRYQSMLRTMNLN
jgi:TolB-like protein